MLMWIWHQIFFCKRRAEKFFNIQPVKNNISSHKFPWLWIGTYSDGKLLTLTDIVNQSVQYGICVDVNFLKHVTNINSDKWLYLDNKTLEEKVFPLGGFVIKKNDTDQSRTS